MIIWGSRGMTSTAGSGTFACPNCNDKRPYSLRHVKRWFTLYFIPIFPISGKVGEFVQCSGCRGQFRKEVLSHDPQSQQRTMDAAVQMGACMLAAEGVKKAGRQARTSPAALGEALAGVIGAQPPEDMMRSLLAEPPDDRGAIDAMRSLGASINEQGKEMIYRAALAGVLLDSNGEVSDASTRFLDEVAKAMNMSPAHVRGIWAGG